MKTHIVYILIIFLLVGIVVFFRRDYTREVDRVARERDSLYNSSLIKDEVIAGLRARREVLRDTIRYIEQLKTTIKNYYIETAGTITLSNSDTLFEVNRARFNSDVIAGRILTGNQVPVQPALQHR